MYPRTSQVVLLGLLVALSATAVGATETVEGVLSLTPVGEHSCLAVEIPTEDLSSLVGLTWYHNDGTMPFDRLLLLEGQPGQPPNLQNVGLVLEEITGQSLAWGEVTFETAVSSSTGLIWAIFEIPAYTERTGEGEGGGPGLGYVLRPGPTNAFLSADGIKWAPLQAGYSLAVEGVVGGVHKATSTARMLSDLQEQAPEGWWSNLQPEDDATGETVAETSQDSPAVATASRPLVVAPNPFNPRTKVAFYLEKSGPVALEIFDIRGRMVRQLENGPFPAGGHELVWDGTDGRARSVASGVYFVRVTTPSRVLQQRVALVR